MSLIGEICRYIDENYKVPFNGWHNEWIWPDIFIAHGGIQNKRGLFLCVKNSEKEVFNKNMGLKKEVKPQNDLMVKLIENGYECHFVWSFDMAKAIIDNYLKGWL